MFAAILGVAFVGLFRQGAPVYEEERGLYLVHACQAALRVMDVNKAHFLDGDVAQGDYCVGYLNGFKDGGQLKNWSICVGNTAAILMARSFVTYMNQNPQLMQKDKSEGLLLALRNSYPCPSKAQ